MGCESGGSHHPGGAPRRKCPAVPILSATLVVKNPWSPCEHAIPQVSVPPLRWNLDGCPQKNGIVKPITRLWRRNGTCWLGAPRFTPPLLLPGHSVAPKFSQRLQGRWHTWRRFGRCGCTSSQISCSREVSFKKESVCLRRHACML